MTDSTREAAPSTTTESGEPQKLASPLGPLLWLLIPFLICLVYGIFGS